MHCEGKCVMMKKMIEAEKKDQQSPLPKFEIKNDVFTSESSSYITADFSLSEKVNSYTIVSGKSSAGFLQTTFHPPAFC
jgi:hypothetical protein